MRNLSFSILVTTLNVGLPKISQQYVRETCSFSRALFGSITFLELIISRLFCQPHQFYFSTSFLEANGRHASGLSQKMAQREESRVCPFSGHLCSPRMGD